MLKSLLVVRYEDNLTIYIEAILKNHLHPRIWFGAVYYAPGRGRIGKGKIPWSKEKAGGKWSPRSTVMVGNGKIPLSREKLMLNISLVKTTACGLVIQYAVIPLMKSILTMGLEALLNIRERSQNWEGGKSLKQWRRKKGNYFPQSEGEVKPI